MVSIISPTPHVWHSITPCTYLHITWVNSACHYRTTARPEQKFFFLLGNRIFEKESKTTVGQIIDNYNDDDDDDVLYLTSCPKPNKFQKYKKSRFKSSSNMPKQFIYEYPFTSPNQLILLWETLMYWALSSGKKTSDSHKTLSNMSYSFTSTLIQQVLLSIEPHSFSLLCCFSPPCGFTTVKDSAQEV